MRDVITCSAAHHRIESAPENPIRDARCQIPNPKGYGHLQFGRPLSATLNLARATVMLSTLVHLICSADAGCTGDGEIPCVVGGLSHTADWPCRRTRGMQRVFALEDADAAYAYCVRSGELMPRAPGSEGLAGRSGKSQCQAGARLPWRNGARAHARTMRAAGSTRGGIGSRLRSHDAYRVAYRVAAGPRAPCSIAHPGARHRRRLRAIGHWGDATRVRTFCEPSR
ncbi:hypothetical protein DENSPDRAFT_345515 [Dentipellis sp. KUC8613]|nr:hypothetical protein DENSPDRAFT_345515 [Dentipellis sp. KUC8613]